jgi:transcriptional regulator of acetoin/glycerol metabolism
VLQALLAYQWPGNIREFRNVVEAIFVNSPGTEIRLHDIPAHFRSRLITLGPAGSLSEEERVLLALAGSQWNKSKAAERLSCSRMTLYRKMAKYQIRATGIPSGPLAEPYP